MNRIQNPSLQWSADSMPESPAFDDVYYSRESSLEETNLVFLNGNNLPHNWLNKKQFTIGETGFGTGLSFLAAWKMFDETAAPDQRLDFISVEKFPMTQDDVRRALTRFKQQAGAHRVERLLEIYPLRIPGFHRRHVTDRITLTVVFDDALRAFRQMDCEIDAWFLDGFTPRRNPDLWTPEVFSEMARLSHSETTLASFTGSGLVRQPLEDAGFAITRLKGFGTKRFRIIGKAKTPRTRNTITPPEHVTIIGAGLAGATVSHALQRRSIRTTILEKEATTGCGASGNRLGLINPKLEAQDNARNDAGLNAFSFATHFLEDFARQHDISYRRSGALHLGFDADKLSKLRKLYDAASWLQPHMQWVTATQTKEICGIDLPFEGLFYPDAACVNTACFVQEMLQNTDVRFNQNISAIPEGPVILANGFGLKDFLPELPLSPVRGQVTYAEINDLHLNCPIMFGSYIAPVNGNLFSLGATFDRGITDTATQEKDDARNLAAIEKHLGLKGSVTTSWANIRTASNDRFPIVGRIANTSHYISGALGSHGIQFSLLHAEILACLLTGAPMPIGCDALKALSVGRFQIKET